MANEIINLPTTFEEKLAVKRAAYAKAFRVDDLNDANDLSTLDILLKTEIMVDDLQAQIQELMSDNPVEQATNIKKLADLLRDAGNMILAYQKTLSIDRKTRKTEETASVADYIRALKRDAREFMDQRIVKVYCPDCKVMVGRLFPVHDHTAFNASFQCDQCNKVIRARREERDIFFDIRDASWRRKYSPEIVQPKKFSRMQIPDDDELVIDGDPNLEVESGEALQLYTPADDIVLGGDDGTSSEH